MPHHLSNPILVFIPLCKHYIQTTTSSVLDLLIPDTRKKHKFLWKNRSKVSTAATSSKRAKFEGVFARIKDELIEHIAGQGMTQDAVEWCRNSLEYNVPGGKLIRGMSVIDTVQIFKGRELSDDEYFKAAILGWCIEIFQAYGLVADDIMDQSLTRRGQPCWYRLPHVGMMAIHDVFMFGSAIFHLLKVHFRNEVYYADLLDLLHEVSYKSVMGQLLDLITAPEDKIDLSKFSLEKYRRIAIYKTAYYTFYLPIACAMLMLGVPETYTIPPSITVHPYEIAASILLPLGEYFQIQDDYLDYSGTPEKIGKIGTDIVDNKCSWVINTALSLANPAQRAILDENYGRKDVENEANVKAVFAEIGVGKVYKEYEKRVVNELKQKIRDIVEVEGGLKRKVFDILLEKIYKRTK